MVGRPDIAPPGRPPRSAPGPPGRGRARPRAGAPGRVHRGARPRPGHARGRGAPQRASPRGGLAGAGGAGRGRAWSSSERGMVVSPLTHDDPGRPAPPGVAPPRAKSSRTSTGPVDTNRRELAAHSTGGVTDVSWGIGRIRGEPSPPRGPDIRLEADASPAVAARPDEPLRPGLRHGPRRPGDHPLPAALRGRRPRAGVAVAGGLRRHPVWRAWRSRSCAGATRPPSGSTPGWRAMPPRSPWSST